MNIIERFKELPSQTKTIMAVGAVMGLLVALPLFIYAVLFGNFELRRKAATGEPTPSPSGACTDIVGQYCDVVNGTVPACGGTGVANGVGVCPAEQVCCSLATPTPLPTPVCIPQSQSATIVPTSQVGTLGQTLTYQVQITNNDSLGCSPSIFDITPRLPFTNWVINFTPTSISIDPGQTSSVLMEVTSAPYNSSTDSLPVGADVARTGYIVYATAAYTVSTSTPSPSPAGTICLASDINKDGITDITDYSIFVSDFFESPPTNPRSDINNDGIVDITDYSLLVTSFFSSTGTCQ